MRAMQDVVGGLGAAVIGAIQSSSLLLLPTPHIEEKIFLTWCDS